MNTLISACKVTKHNALKLLREGVISCVLSQDWQVNRIVPEFLNKAKFKSVLISKNTLLHLGVGNGECYRYFDKKCSQISISDKLYIDPYDFILLYLKRCDFSIKEIELLAELMRDEYLIAISLEELYNGNEDVFHKKDFTINRMLTHEFCQKNSYSYSYNVILLLVHILNSNPSLLLPTIPYKRMVTPMGKHIVEQKILLPIMLTESRFNAFITIEDVENIAIKHFGAIDEMYLSKFENITLLDDIHFDYILASRSDAFLKERYTQFILDISKHLSKEGFYISDGILCSYSYKILYNDLDNIIKQIGEDRVYFIKAEKSSTSLPLREISGIIIMGDDAKIERTYSFISQSKLISAHQIFNCEFFLRQCIWTDLFEWASHNGVNLEKYEFLAINGIINKYIEQKRTNLHFPLKFDDEELFIKELNLTQ